MSERIVQVGVDLVRRKVGSLPGQSLDQDGELLQVSGGSADTAPVGLSKVHNAHGEYSQRAGESTPNRHPWSLPYIRYNRTRGQLAQLYRSRLYGFCLWLLTRRYPILRAAWLALLVVGLALHRLEGVLALLVLGHFRQAWNDLMDRCAPRTGLSQPEVNK